VDVVCGDHRAFPLGAGAVLDAAEDSPLALPEFVEDIGVHSKAAVVWDSEDVFLPLLFPDCRRFSSVFGRDEAQKLQITLGSGLVVMSN
jgi:hypothetical protein